MAKRGWNLRAGEFHGDRGRSMAGRIHAAQNRVRIDDSGRTHGQYWGQVGFCKLATRLGSEEAARAHMAGLGVLAYDKERQEFSRYLYEMRNPRCST
jgi:hypothetical protein